MNNHTDKTEGKSRVGRRVLLLLATVITALAVAVTCAVFTTSPTKKVSVDNDVEQTEATTSANYTNVTGNTIQTYINNGTFTNNNYIDYSYNGSYYSVTLPQGTWKFELWGGRGGYTGNNGANTGTANGGLGGYSYGQITYTSATTIYIYCGGTGAAGTGSIDGNNTTWRYGGYNGGGGTDIRTSTSTSNRIIVACGGGGGSATGTTQKFSSCGVLFQGASGDVSRHRSSYSNDEGGGGGGYYGGAVVHGDDPISSYCGSNYISGSFTSSGNSYGNSSASGNGRVRITAISINQAPVSLNKTITLPARTGNAISQAITASSLAQDSDHANHANATLTGVYFTDGNASAVDTFTTTANQRLWVNSACTTLATEYFDWTWSSNSQLNITKIKKYPRAGYDGCTTNGTIKLYVKIRDNFGTSTSSRAFSVIPFTVVVPANTISQRTNAAADVVSSQTGGNKLHFGLSKTATAPAGSAIDTTNLYNPLGTNRYTAVFEQPIRYNEGVKINASDLIKGFNNSLDKIVASFSSVSSITGSSRKYKINEYDANTAGGTAYNSAKAKLSYVYDTLTFTCITPDPAYQVFSVTVYEVEKTPVNAMGLSNVEANVTSSTSTRMTVDIVFKMDNTRPTVRTNVAPVATVGTLASATFSLNTYFTDIDGANGTINSTSHQIKEVVVPTHEFLLTNKYGEVQTTKNGSNSYFNVIADNTNADRFTGVLATGQLKGENNTTGFESWYISNGSANTDVAFVQYSFSNDTITLTGLRASYSMYKSTRTSAQAATGGSISGGVQMASGVANAGHFYILIRVQDKNDTSDNGIWLPLGIQVTNRAPNTLQTERNASAVSEMPTANGDKGEVFYFTPMGITISQQTYPIGMLKVDDSTYSSAGLRPLAGDADNFFTTNMLRGQSITSVGQTGAGKLNELVRISSSLAQIQSSISANQSGYYFTVDYVDIYIPTAYFGGRVSTVLGELRDTNSMYGQCVVIKGLKITLNNWTHNRFLHLEVKVKDSAEAEISTYIAVNVSNKAPVTLDSANVAQLGYTYNGVTVRSTYTQSTATIKYSVPAHSTVLVSPYDLITDENMTNAGISISNGFTLNGLSGGFNTSTGVFSVNGPTTGTNIINIKGIATSANSYPYYGSSYTESLFNMIGALQAERTFNRVTADNRFGTTSSGTTSIDKLYFARTIDGSSLDPFTYDPYSNTNRQLFASADMTGDGYVSYSFGSKIEYSNKSYNIDYAVITANRRTLSGSPAVLEFTVRDRTGASASDDAYGIIKIRVEIDVINSSPRVQYPEKYYTLTTNPLSEESVENSNSFIPGSIKPSTLVIYAATDSVDEKNNFLVDNEDSEVWFDITGGFQVVDKNDSNGSEVDFAGRSYNGNYVNVTMTATTLTIVALNSTQAVETLYIRFYATDGRYNDSGTLERSVCYVRIEVINAGFTYNTGDNGFVPVYDGESTNVDQYLWDVESLTAQDMSRARFFVSGSDAATAVRAEFSASSGQIKYLISDTDSLQGVVISAARAPGSTNPVDVGYRNANLSGCTTDDEYIAAYKLAVPQLGIGWNTPLADRSNSNLAIGALIALRQGINYDTTDAGLKKKIDVEGTDIVYFVRSGSGYTAYKASDLVKEDAPYRLNVYRQLFDEEGRWAVTDWAIMVKPNSSSDASQYINLRISMRDETKLGGDTAGLATAHDAGNANKVVVFANQLFSYDMFINGIGIVPYTYYNQFDGFYTVADPADSNGAVYVPTYDGIKTSQYDAESDIKNLYYDGSSKVITTQQSAGVVTLKNRSANGTDETFAGVHSGVEYSIANANATNGFNYPIRSGGNVVSGRRESAFKYSDTIHVSGNSNEATYVPMSYFALNKDFYTINDTTGAISFKQDSYISYDTGDVNGYQLRYMGYGDAVTISDGVDTWKGSDTNPYVAITFFDLVGNTYKQEDETKLLASPYLNNRLSIPTYKEDGVEQFINVESSRGLYANDVVGEYGRMLYLSNQLVVNNAEKQYGLQEHLFGLKLSKKDTRAQVASLTITVKVVACTFNSVTNKVMPNYGGYGDSDGAQYSATLTFKLEIGNSPIDLEQTSNGVKQHDAAGYYIEMLDLTTDMDTQYIALSRASTVPDISKVIKYTDADVVYNSDNTVNASKSDTAKFSYSSLRQLKYLTGYQRVLELDEDSANTNITFSNTSTSQYAQTSIKNYLNARDKSAVDSRTSEYQPNTGFYAYNNNEGYDKYFSVGVSLDGSTLSITPKAKTSINPDMIGSSNLTAVSDYYLERGLKLIDSNNAGGGAYYPLKVLIYDDHGDGFGAASYVAVEIRVAISGSSAKLVDNLEDYASDGSKQINVSLAINQPYTLNISHVITSDSLLKTGTNFFWKADYDLLKEKAGNRNNYDSETLRRDDMFRLESGTYLVSPFNNRNNIQTYSTNANTIAQDNLKLRQGNAVYSSNPNYIGVSYSYMPDVIMYMDYYNDNGGAQVQDALAYGAIPIGNDIMFRANRRTTYQTTVDNVTTSVQQDDFSFKINFTDSDGNKTKDLYIKINVVNQTPTIRGKAVNKANGLQMQVGDSFTVVTTPYNRFVGSEANESSSDYTTPTPSARASTSYDIVANRADPSHRYANIMQANLLAENATVKYEQLTERNIDGNGQYALHSYVSDGGSNQHLGYLAIADDDMPWGLRLESVDYYNDNCFELGRRGDGLPLEGSSQSTGMQYCLDITITASSVCTNMPVTITVVDANMARITFTMYVTVVSSKPVAIDYGDNRHTLNAALSPVYENIMGSQVLQKGVYSMYMIADNVTDKNTTQNINNVPTVTATYKDVTLNTGRSVKAYGKVRLPLDEIAYDADSGDILALYSEDRADYNVFSFNNTAMSKDPDNRLIYYNDMFTIEISPDYRWFTIECKTYNSSFDEDVIRFYVRDSGNNIFENAIPIEIRLSTLYSSITNDAQMTNSSVRQEQFQRGSIASVNVKSFDDYSGYSIDLPEDEDERNTIVDVQSTFQFLTYPGMPASVDQTAASARPLTDPDIMHSSLNRHYEVRIYAFMATVGSSESEYQAMSLENISSLFNLNPSVVNKKVLALKSESDLSNNAFLNEKHLNIDSFLIGGFYDDGTTMTHVNRSLVLFLQRYFMFDVGDDGVSLLFRPVSANIDVEIPLYVQIEKHIADTRAVNISNVDTACGDIFYVNVMDSAPIATEEESVLSYEGDVTSKKDGQNDNRIFIKLYDNDDPYGSLFTDSDLNDYVVYDGFQSSTVLTPDYNRAFSAATAAEIDWRANEGINKPQAFTIEVNNSSEPVEGIPAYTIAVTINRRIDVQDADGNYLSEVDVPFNIYGKDRAGQAVEVQVTITIKNADIDLDASKIIEVTPDPVNGYYQLSVDEENYRSYFIDAYMVPQRTLAPFYFVDSQGTYVADPDYTRMRTDTDSMRLVGAESAESNSYLMYGKELTVRSDKANEDVAVIKPLFGFDNNVMPEDKNHFAGFSINLLSYNRNIDDATAKMRIIDRSGDPTNPFLGFTVTVRIHILNAAPTLKAGVENKPFIVTGYDTRDGEPIVIDINDYVEDLNGDALRIAGVSAVYEGNPSNGNQHCVRDSDSASDLVGIAIADNMYNCTFTPKAGYYGEQYVSVIVADVVEGADAIEYSTVEFILHFIISYDISDIKLNDITAIRSLPTKIDAAALFNSIDDTFGIKDHATEEPGKFNPGAEYAITELTASGNVRVYKDGDDWMIKGESVAENIRMNVTFKNKTAIDDPDVKSIHMTFNVTVIKNNMPTLKEYIKNNNEEGLLFETGRGSFVLDNNGTAMLNPTDLFDDVELPLGDQLTFDAKSVSVSSPTICSVRVSEDGTLLYITFNFNGECNITIGVMDCTGEVTKVTFKIKNIDRPDPSFWDKIMISYEVNPIIWWGVGIGILVLIALIILIVILVKRRKRKQEELEAILLSEMELEEQMMRLGASSMGMMQSFGYLPPTMPTQNDPGLMLGAGENVPPQGGAIGLNPGAPTDPNNPPVM